MSSLVLAASVETHPVPLKDRLRFEMWHRGISEFKRPVKVSKKALPEELERVLRKLEL